MTLEGFTLDDIIFPVSPTELQYHGLDDFQWPYIASSVCGTGAVVARVAGTCEVVPRVAGTAESVERVTATAAVGVC